MIAILTLDTFRSVRFAYSHVDHIRGWGHYLFFIGTFSLIDALNMTICFFGVISIPEKMQTGELDLYLTKPVNPLLRITFEKVNPGAIPLLAFSVCIIVYGVKESSMSLSYANIIGYLFLVFLMTILYYDLDLLIRRFAFLFFSVNNLVKIENTATDLCLKIPGIAFSEICKFIFYCVLPYGVIAMLPTQAFIGTLLAKGLIFWWQSCAFLLLLHYLFGYMEYTEMKAQAVDKFLNRWDRIMFD